MLKLHLFYEKVSQTVIMIKYYEANVNGILLLITEYNLIYLTNEESFY
ncbi:hypothetical protein KL86DYS1_31401 [uncultured Dysgonomonas sp.]|uniref:Uncharacterized protein n=1 Tax=uncultured Dysgonomonas sp. TaxID=206096 RepID=A0A212K490_9BACT|nr:hypothetical protein KL86DYS1_31401 [uncultured Dysgonomonas sp.]